MVTWTDEARIGFPYWWEALRRAPAPEPDPLPERVDLLVIGAGYTGLSAALVAHDHGARVAVVDAQDPGHGASTRNGGMFGAHPRLGWSQLARQYGASTADALFAEAAPAQAWVTALIEREAIACDFQRTGRVQLAWARAHQDVQQQLAADITAKSTVRTQILDRKGIAAEITTPQYVGGLLFPDHCAIHPARFHRGLWHAARRRGIPVTGHARVTGYERRDAGFRVQTTKGQIRADKIILATNGYTTRPFRWFSARVFAMPSYIIATQELSADLIRALAPGGRMMVETRARHSYFRATPDGKRLLFGGRAAMRDIPLELAARRQHATMCEVWPELTDVRLSHVWTGNTGYSFGHIPHVGEDRGLHYAMGFSGSGTVLAPYLGAKAAYRAMGSDAGDTAYAQTHIKRHWMHPVQTPHFLRAADLWYRIWVDRQENARARRGR